MRWPLAASPAGASCARAEVRRCRTPRCEGRNRQAQELVSCSSPQRGSVTTSTSAGSPVLTTAMRALQRGRELVGIADRALAMDPEASRDGRVVDVRIFQRGADIASCDAAAAARRPSPAGTCIPDDRRGCCARRRASGSVVRGGPQRAGREHEVAVAAEGNGEPAVPLVGECRAEGSRQLVADAAAARSAVPADTASGSPTADAASYSRMEVPTSDQSSSLIWA